MAKQNSVNLDITNNADGFDISGGTTSRKLTVSGADLSLTGSGSATLTFPTTSTTIAGLGITQTFTAIQSFGQGSTAAGEIRLLEDTDDGSNYTGLRGSARSTNITYVMPTSDPTQGQMLSADGPISNVSQLSWANKFARSILNISTTTSAGSTASTDYVYNVTSGTFTLTMPTAASNTNRYTIKQSGTGVLTIATTSSQTIDGSTTYTMSKQYQAIDLISDGTNWIIV
jgi:hypothetical protein